MDGLCRGVPDLGDERPARKVGVGGIGLGGNRLGRDWRGAPASPSDSLNLDTFARLGLAGASEEVGGSDGADTGAGGTSSRRTEFEGPTFVNLPFFSSSSMARAFSSSAVTSSSLSPSSPPTSLPFSNWPIRTARFTVLDFAMGTTVAPSECDARESVLGGARTVLLDLNRDTDGFGGSEANVASSGTS